MSTLATIYSIVFSADTGNVLSKNPCHQHLFLSEDLYCYGKSNCAHLQMCSKKVA